MSNGVDMSKMVEVKSDQLNSDSLLCGPLSGTIKRVFSTGNPDQPVGIELDSWPQPYKPCKGMRRCLVELYGTKGDDYVGKSLTLFRNPEVRYGGIACGGIEISHASGIDKPRTFYVTVTRGKKKPLIVEPFKAAKTPTKADHSAEVVSLCLAYQKVTNEEGMTACKAEAQRLWPLIDDAAKASITARVEEAKARITAVK